MSVPSNRPGDADDVPRDSAVEHTLQVYLERVAEGESPHVDDFAARLSGEAARSEFRVEALAAEWLWRREAGERTELGSMLARLVDEDERARLRDAVAAADEASRVLPWRLEPGARLAGRYEVLRYLDSGGNGVVYAAQDLELKRNVALKAVRIDPRKDLGSLAQNLLDESITLAALRSPHIVQVFDVLRDGDRVCLVLDLVDGIDLHYAVEELARKRDAGTLGLQDRLHVLQAAVAQEGDSPGDGIFAEKDWYRAVATLLVRLCHALERAHGAGVLHRDLKSKNVMLGRDGEPVLLDFGFAHRVGSTSQGFCGTPSYVAPEQIRGQSTGEDPRTDVYTFGLLMYELFELRQAFPQFPEESWSDLSERILRRRFPPLASLDPHLPSALRAVCEKAMNGELGERYPSMTELRTDLERFLRGLPPQHARLSFRQATWMRVRSALRRPAIVVAGAVGIVAALAVWMFWPEPVGLFLESRIVHTPGGSVVAAKDGMTLAAGDQLGARLVGDRRGAVYTVSVFGDSLDSLRVRPTKPRLMASRDALDATKGTWGVLVPAGRHDIACAQLDEGEVYAYEGFEILVCPEEDPWLDALMADLDGMDTGRGVPTFQYEIKLNRTTRGGSPDKRKYDVVPEAEEGIHAYRKVYQVNP